MHRRSPKVTKTEYDRAAAFLRSAGATIAAVELEPDVERMADWADKNYDEFMTKLYPRVITRDVEHHASEGVEDLLEKLDRQMVDITPEVVE